MAKKDRTTKPKIKVAVTTYYKGTALDGTTKKLEQFIESIKNNNSEVYLQILCFLYEQIPFTSKNIDCIRKKYYSFDEKEYEGISIYQRNYKKKNSIQIKTPKKSSMLSPAGTFLNKRLRIRSFTLNEEAKQIIKDELSGLSYSERKTS